MTSGAAKPLQAYAAPLSQTTRWVWDMNPVDLKDVDLAKVDVTSAEQIAQAVDQIVNQQLRIDILVNNAGYLGKLRLPGSRPG